MNFATFSPLDDVRISSNSSSNSLGMVVWKRCVVCPHANTQHRKRNILNSEMLPTNRLVQNFIPSVAQLGDVLQNDECHFNDIIAPSCVNKITGRNAVCQN